MSGITIIPMKTEHLEQVYDIETRSFAVPWSKESLFYEITSNEKAYYVVALLDGVIVGYAGMWHIVNEGHITNIASDPIRRRAGVGGALLGHLIQIAQERGMIGVTLEVRVNNYDAQRLYFKHGFALEGIRKNYYSDTKEDALVLWKWLEDPAEGS